MQQVFLDFVEESIDSPRRKQEGIYDYYDIKLGYCLYKNFINLKTKGGDQSESFCLMFATIKIQLISLAYLFLIHKNVAS